MPRGSRPIRIIYTIKRMAKSYHSLSFLWPNCYSELPGLHPLGGPAYASLYMFYANYSGLGVMGNIEPATTWTMFNCFNLQLCFMFKIKHTIGEHLNI